MDQMRLRIITPDDRHEVAELIYCSINVWYQSHGKGLMWTGGPQMTEIFYDVYSELDGQQCAVVAENSRTGRLMGSCFYHPREHHVSLGIMNVHPNYFGRGVARALLHHVIDFTDAAGKPLRLTQSALNLDSFSLYNRAGFVPRCAFQDLLVPVPSSGLKAYTPGMDRVRRATPDDIPAMTRLEMQVSGIARPQDYAYCIRNRLGFWSVSVCENPDGDIDGFLIASSHPAMNMLGPCIARDESTAAALLLRELDNHRGKSPVFLVPVERDTLVRQVYDWGGRNCELHFCQIRGQFQPFAGISMPTFLPETG